MPPFVLLKNPETYRPCGSDDMLTNARLRNYWIDHFESHFIGTFIPQCVATYGESSRSKIEAALADMLAIFTDLRRDPASHGPLDLYVLDMIRQRAIIKHGVPDPFHALKTRENALMIKQYRHVVDELDSHRDDHEMLLLALEGVFAGNIYDLGAGATSKLFATSSPDFIDVRNKITRPWLIDDFDAYSNRFFSRPSRKTVFFLDNAGSDCILGVIPFVRMLANRGTKVIVAANTLPALNDITAAELLELLPNLAMLDPILAAHLKSKMIEVIPSGSGAPLIDLNDMSEELNAASAGADLVYLEGMGRSLESNFETKFNIDAVKLCMIKDQLAATRHGGKLFDTVLKFEPSS
jgi:type II pantothenate kinase